MGRLRRRWASLVFCVSWRALVGSGSAVGEAGAGAGAVECAAAVAVAGPCVGQSVARRPSVEEERVSSLIVLQLLANVVPTSARLLCPRSRDYYLSFIIYLFNYLLIIPPLIMLHQNTSEYTLDTVHDTAPLLQDSPSFYGSHDTHPRPSPTRLLLAAALRMAALFLVASLLLGGTLFLALPTLDPCVYLPYNTVPWLILPPATTVCSSTYPNHSMISRHSTAS